MTRIGFIGIGIMGKSMATHLLDAGYPLTIHDVRKEAGADLIARGAVWAESVAATARASDVVFTALPHPKDVQAVALGPSGILENLAPGKTYVDLSTNSPTVVRAIYRRGRELGVDVLDATMSGGAHGAAMKRLTLMVGGDEAVFERCRPILEAMSDHVAYCGKSGAGAVTKIVNNLIALATSILLGEALLIGTKAGVDLERLTSVISKSTGASWRLNESFPRYILKGNFQPGFAVDLAVKDLKLAKEMADEFGLRFEFLELAVKMYEEAQRRGWGGLHSEAVVKLLEEKVGVELRLPGQHA